MQGCSVKVKLLFLIQYKWQWHLYKGILQFLADIIFVTHRGHLAVSIWMKGSLPQLMFYHGSSATTLDSLQQMMKCCVTQWMVTFQIEKYPECIFLANAIFAKPFYIQHFQCVLALISLQRHAASRANLVTIISCDLASFYLYHWGFMLQNKSLIFPSWYITSESLTTIYLPFPSRFIAPRHINYKVSVQSSQT